MSDRHHELSALLKDAHGVEVSPEELELLFEYLWLNCASEGLSDEEITADVGRALLTVAGAVLGGFFLPGLGIVAGWGMGAIVGGSIGYRLGGLFETKPNQERNPVKSIGAEEYGFGSVGSIAQLNSPIPIIYGNRANNPDGGVYRQDPAIIWSKIYSDKGGQYLERLSLLAAGKLEQVNPSRLLLDRNPISDYGVSDVSVQVSPGSHQQDGFGIATYSQAVSIAANGFIGLAAGTQPVATQVTESAVVPSNPQGGAIAAGRFTKTATTQAWDAAALLSAYTMPPSGGYGRFVEFSAIGNRGTNANLLWILGASNPAISSNYFDSFAVAIASDGANYYIRQGSTQIATGALPNGNQRLKLRIYRGFPQNYAQCFVGDVEVWEAPIGLLDCACKAACFYEGNYFEAATLGESIPTGTIGQGIGQRVQATIDGLNLFSAGDRIRLARGENVTVVGKNTTNQWIEFDREIWIDGQNRTSVWAETLPRVKTGEHFARSYQTSITTSRPVNQIDLDIKSVQWARNETGDYIDHGTVFGLYIKGANETSYQKLGNFVIGGKSENPSRHNLSILGLPLDRYSLSLIPFPGVSDSAIGLFPGAPIQVVPTGVSIGLNPITIAAESNRTLTPGECNISIAHGGAKKQTSGDSQPSIVVEHINEIVIPAAPPTYGGYTIARSRILASDRISSAPSEMWDIPKGRICPNHLYYGRSSTAGGANECVVSSPIANLVAGDILRILGRGFAVLTAAPAGNVATLDRIQAIGSITSGSSLVAVPPAAYNSILVGMPVTGAGIPAGAIVSEKRANNNLLLSDEWGRRIAATATSSPTLAFNEYLPKIADGEVVIYRMGASNYFPDLYVDRLTDKLSGLGEWIDRDTFIDYKSIVECRQFCAANQFFFDGVFDSGSFEDWALAAAPSSLLFCTQIEGRYALIPLTDAPPNYIFNNQNTSKYTESSTPWQNEIVNTVLVKYQDNRGRERQVKIQTLEANQGAEAEIVQPIDTQAVTLTAQAIKVGQVALKSLRLQTRTCSLDTDISAGLYARQGDIVRTQHACIEYGNQASGTVLTVEAWQATGAGIQVVTFSDIPPALTVNSRITIARQDKTVEGEKTLTALGGGRYAIAGLSAAVGAGSVYAIGESSQSERIWRITSVKPSITDNSVTLTGILWTPEILSPSGLMTVF